MMSRAHFWRTLGGTTIDAKLTMSSYIDNLFNIGDSPSNAVRIQEDFEIQLAARWNQRIKPSSCSVMAPKGCLQQMPDPRKWPRTEVMECLGFQIQHNAETNLAWNHTKNMMWRAFFANCAKSDARGLQTRSKMKVLTRAVRPRLLYRAIAMPLTQTRIQAIDTQQRKMVAATARLKFAPGEDPAPYCRRRNRQASALLEAHGKWSRDACKALYKFDLHVRRNSSGKLWASSILRTRDETWLHQRRAACGLHTGRTDTRALRGHVAQRWEPAAKLARAHVRRSDLVD